MNWYLETKEKLYVLFDTSDQGLTTQQAAQRQIEYGPNQINTRKDSIWKVVLEPFRNVFVAVLLTAAVVSLLSHEVLDAAIIAVIVIINATIFYTQHYATQRVLRSLKRHSQSKVLVPRGGAEKEVSSVELVPGDMIIINEGDRVPADSRIVHTNALQINESSLTGESVPVRKHASTLQSEKKVFEQDNMAFQGTYVLQGSARALVVATGAQTEFGKIAQLASEVDTKSPVQQKIDALVTVLIKVIGVVVAVVFVLALWRDMPTNEALRFVLSLSVSAVPEGLPVALTVIIVLGMRRMAKQKALVRSFKAIEDVGLITTIATDKTGTLTKNHLTVVEEWSPTPVRSIEAIQKTINVKESQADPLDVAIAESSHKQGRTAPDKLYPFELAMRMSGAYYHATNTVYIKGSPEHILANSVVPKHLHTEAESVMHSMASKGYRVIAVARSCAVGMEPSKLQDVPKRLEFIGFVAFADELRPDATHAVSLAHQAGINVKLITGDHYETAYNVGRSVGIAQKPEDVITGDELLMNPSGMSTAVQTHSVFARILPEDKFAILQNLKQTEITAMTGDGVNDVPALSSAHVGFAMGSGNDIARDAGDIVLLNDNFSTIIRAIAEGRKIYDNIRRMLYYLLSTTLGEAITMIGALIVGLPLPVTAIQILWINLVTDTAMVLPLGLESAEDGHMKRPPRRPEEPLLNITLLSRMVVVAGAMAVTTLVAINVLSDQGHTKQYIQTVAFMMLIAAQWMNAFNARSELKSSFSRLGTTNRGLAAGLVVAVILQGLVMFGPLAPVFKVESVPAGVLAFWSALIAAIVLLVAELHKLICRHLSR